MLLVNGSPQKSSGPVAPTSASQSRLPDLTDKQREHCSPAGLCNDVRKKQEKYKKAKKSCRGIKTKLVFLDHCLATFSSILQPLLHFPLRFPKKEALLKAAWTENLRSFYKRSLSQ